MENYKEENRQLKQNKTLMTREAEERKKDVQKLERKLELLAKLEDECHRLQEENQTLIRDASTLQEQFESVIMEKEDLEYQTQEAIQALNDEREAKDLLELRLKEDSYSSPVHKTRAEEWSAEQAENAESKESADRERIVSSPPPSEQRFDPRIQSTPFPSGKEQQPSLLNEIQDSFVVDKADREELENLRKKLAEMEEKMEETVSTFQKEKKVLEDTVAASSARESKQVKELEDFKDEFSKGARDKDKTIEELNQRISIREEQIEQLRSKLSTANAERTSMEIEVDGLSNEIQRLKVVSGIETDKIQRECAQELTKNIELRSQISVLEEQIARSSNANEKLEKIIYNSHNELSAMADDIKSLQKVVLTLGVGDGRPSPVAVRPPSKQVFQMDGSREEDGGEAKTLPALANGEREKGEEPEDVPYYHLKVNRQKSSVQVHSESHSLRAVISLREELRSIRSPLEQFTKVMLERSLVASSARYSNGSPLPPPSSPDHHHHHHHHHSGGNRKSALDLEAAISKLKSKLVHKTEELNNLRSIMKARATTAEVATSSLRSKLESQARAFQTETAKLKYQIKILKKERDEQLSLRTMYAKRCEDYIDEITHAKKLLEKRKQEREELMVSLQKTIQRKLELATELEEYKMEQERNVLIPKRLESSRV